MGFILPQLYEKKEGNDDKESKQEDEETQIGHGCVFVRDTVLEIENLKPNY